MNENEVGGNGVDPSAANRWCIQIAGPKSEAPGVPQLGNTGSVDAAAGASRNLPAPPGKNSLFNVRENKAGTARY